MILINFSHPITADQQKKIEAITNQSISEVFETKVNFNLQEAFAPQVEALLDQIPLTERQLQELPILINLPALNYIAGLLLAGLHGRMGYFPPVIRLRPVAGLVPPQYEVAEILELQAFRDEERRKRF